MKLSIVIPVMNQVDMASEVYLKTQEMTNMVESHVEFIIIDNGSTPKLSEVDFPGATILRFDKSIGVYPTFKVGFDNSKGDVVAFFHSDLIVWEEFWNDRVTGLFSSNPNLGMIGFIGSNEIDSAGGRGGGTTSNFQGNTLVSKKLEADVIGDDYRPAWVGSPASAHGRQNEEASRAAVVDGCAMIIRRDAWVDIGFREDFPLHHFYDRLISTQLLEKGWDINVLGISCDHFSGQTVNKENAYHEMAGEWCRKNVAQANWVTDSQGNVNWDGTIYQEAERRWLREYRAKGFVPIRK